MSKGGRFMYCKYCGKPIDDDSVYCPVCSRPLTSNPNQTKTDEEKKTPPTDTKVNYQNYVPSVCIDFVSAIKNYYTNYANFNGRARRSEYWWAVSYNALVSTIVTIVPMCVCSVFFEKPEDAVSFCYMLNIIWSLIHILPNISLVVRRLHDIGKSGFNYFLNYVPFVGPFIVLYYMCQSSSYYDNQWGPSHYSSSPDRKSDENTWYCKECGARTPNSSRVCKGCNAERPSVKRNDYEKPPEEQSKKCVCGERVFGTECPNCGRKM